MKPPALSSIPLLFQYLGVAVFLWGAVSAPPRVQAETPEEAAAEKAENESLGLPDIPAPTVDYTILPPPPADDSPAGLADLNVLLHVQAARTPEQEDFAKKMASPSVFRLNRPIFGEWFTRENLPKTSALLRALTKATAPVLTKAKEHWKRPRPYTRSELVNPAVSKPADAGSYPSGHSFGIAVPEFVLAEAFPDRAGEFDAVSRQVMWGRIVGGVHFPSDTEAGRLLAKAVVDDLMKTPGMRQAVEIIRAEVAAAREKAAAK